MPCPASAERTNHAGKKVSGWSIQDIRKIAGLDPSNGFWIEMYGGTAVDGVGEAGLAWTKIPANAAQNIPEPTAWLAWTLVAGAAACRFRGRIREQICESIRQTSHHRRIPAQSG